MFSRTFPESFAKGARLTVYLNFKILPNLHISGMIVASNPACRILLAMATLSRPESFNI